MVWFKVDDNLAFHHKVVAAGNPAMGLWVRAGSACAQQLTDGFIADHMIAALGTKAQAERLVKVGLWDRTEGGYTFHGWPERQPSKADVEAERALHAERMRAYRERKKAARQNPSPQVSESGDASRAEHEQGTNTERAPLVQVSRPDPTRPDPTTEVVVVGAASAAPAHAVSKAKRATQRPDDFRPTQAHIDLAAELGIDLRAEWQQFCDHHDAKGSTYKDWPAALRTWIRNAQKFGRGRQAADQPTRIQQHLALAEKLASDEQSPMGELA